MSSFPICFHLCINLHNMPKLMFRIFIVFCICNISANIYGGSRKLDFFTIDDRDSVNFNLKSAVLNGNILEIPVWIESDDLIYALDFEMTFDTEKMEYQSIIDHTGYIQYNAFQNPLDKKLRFTSNHTAPYNINQKIISVRFKLTSMCINEKDFIKITNFLNGDKCSLKLPPMTICRTTSTNDVDQIFHTIHNPISNDFEFSMPARSMLSLCSLDGITVFQLLNTTNREKMTIIPVNNTDNGIYILYTQVNNFIFSKKIIIQK